MSLKCEPSSEPLHMCRIHSTAVQDYGAIGMLQTCEGFQRRGLGTLVVSSLANHMQDAYIAGSHLARCRANMARVRQSRPDALFGTLVVSSLADQMQEAYTSGSLIGGHFSVKSF